VSVLDLLSQLTRMASVVPLAVAAELAPEGEGATAEGWQELRNTMHALERFWAAPRPFRGGKTGETGASPEEAERELVRRLAAADEEDPWDAIWLREGLGFRWSEAAWDAGRSPRATLPEIRWRLPLHTGMGLSLALRTLAPLTLPRTGRAARTADGDERALERAVERFETLCRDGSRAGCSGAAFEALGLVAWMLHPGRVTAIDRLLGEREPPWRQSFWHGVGRGLYLTPAGSLPRMRPAVHALRSARRQAPEGAARQNAVAGVGWVLALVNVRHPRVVAGALLDAASDAGVLDALADGVARATVVWADAFGAVDADGSAAPDGTLDAFLACRADGVPIGQNDGAEAGARAAELWRDRVAPRCRRALDTWLVDGRLRDHFGGLFRAGEPA